MTIEKRIEADFMKAFKEKNAEVKSLLSTVKGYRIGWFFVFKLYPK